MRPTSPERLGHLRPSRRRTGGYGICLAGIPLVQVAIRWHERSEDLYAETGVGVDDDDSRDELIDDGPAAQPHLGIALGQVRAGRITERTAGAARAFRLTGVLLAATCLLLLPAAWAAGTTAIAVLVMMTVALTLGEMLQSAAGWDVSFARAPADKEAEYLSVFNLGTALEAVAGPVLVTLLVLQVGWIGWTGLAAVLLVAGLAAARLALPRDEGAAVGQVARA